MQESSFFLETLPEREIGLKRVSGRNKGNLAEIFILICLDSHPAILGMGSSHPNSEMALKDLIACQAAKRSHHASKSHKTGLNRLFF